MGWFESLKGWQKGGLVVGVGHIILYFLILVLSLGVPDFEYILIYLEVPWGIVLGLLGFHPVAPPTYWGMVILGLAGTVVYSISGAFIGLILGFQKK